MSKPMHCSLRCVYEECSLKSFNEKRREVRGCDEPLLNDQRRSRDSEDLRSRRLTVPVDRVVNCLSSELLSSRWLPVSSYEHLLLNYGSVGGGKSAATADPGPSPDRCHASSVEEVGVIMATTLRQHHLLVNLQHRIQSKSTFARC